MRSFTTRLAALAIAAFGCSLLAPSAARAEVSGLHLNLTPYAGFVAWDGETNLQDKLIYGGRVGIGFGRVIGVEGSWGQSKSRTKSGQGFYAYTDPSGAPVQDSKFTHLAADLVLNLVPSAPIDPYLLGGWSQHKFAPQDSVASETKRTGFNVGAGLKLHFSPRVALRVEARDMFYKWSDAQKVAGASDKTQSSLTYTGGLMLTLGGTSTFLDADGDGVADKKDECPNTPAGAVVDAKGCPVDTDGDGVPDGIDQCPNTPKGVQVDEKGCPKDSDGDGVFDGIDQCPNTAQGCRVDAQGCPIDGDKDGVCDGVDECANTPAGARVDAKGCPMDSDGDGVYDGIDLCPNTPAGARVDKEGCPIEITKRETEMLDKGVITVRDIYFDTAKWDIKPESIKTLQELCTIFKQWPTLQIEIGGHADARGSDAYNQELTEKRAGSVLDWFKTNCSDATLGNFTSRGYGESQPVGSNKTAKGMALNRRVEFKVMNPDELKKIKEHREMLMKDSSK